MGVWIREQSQDFANLFAPIELVAMRKPKGSLYPPQAIGSVGANAFKG